MNLTIEQFKESLKKLDTEYTFFYQQYVIYVSVHKEDDKIKYELNVEDFDKVVEMEFDEIDHLLIAKAFDNKSLIDIWNYLAQ